MKKRLSRVLNFLAFNLLFFALYLNFIHTDKNLQIQVKKTTIAAPQQQAQLVSNPEQYLKQSGSRSMADAQPSGEDTKGKLAVN